MGLTPAGSIGVAFAVSLAAAAAGGFAYLRSGPQPSGSGEQTELARPGTVSEPDATREPVPKSPRFDLVRVRPDGSGLAAGRAAPGARLRLRSGERTLAEAEAGPSGEFATIFRAAPGDTPQMLVLEAETAGAAPVRSEQQVLVVPPTPDTEGGAPDAAAADWLPAGGLPAKAPSDPPERDAVAAAAILRPDAPTDVTPALDPSAPAGGVALASIDYAEDGSVRLAGTAPPGSRLRIYVDGAHSADRITDIGGRWDARLAGLDAGVYRIRVDGLGAGGEVASRVETPFQRTFPPTGGDAGTVTVQPGNNLWTIARSRYGSGMHYTQIFTANADLIADPDLIYPGQIFVLPELERHSGGPKAQP